MKAFLVVKNRWTDTEHIHPKIFTSENDLKSFIVGWDTTNTAITTHYLIPSIAKIPDTNEIGKK